jgi:hypothetical protein
LSNRVWSNTPGCLPERFDQPKGFSVTAGVDTAAEAERIYNTFAERGTVRMPMAETFFAERFGMVTDRFGTPLDDPLRKSGVICRLSVTIRIAAIDTISMQTKLPYFRFSSNRHSRFA